MSASEKLVCRSKVRIERQRGPTRLPLLPAEKPPLTFGVHSEIAADYEVSPEAFPPPATKLDYVVAAASG